MFHRLTEMRGESFKRSVKHDWCVQVLHPNCVLLLLDDTPPQSPRRLLLLIVWILSCLITTLFLVLPKRLDVGILHTGLFIHSFSEDFIRLGWNRDQGNHTNLSKGFWFSIKTIILCSLFLCHCIKTAPVSFLQRLHLK